jgi:23S rRNA pseudouridine1911/1915/1917 synthase
VTLYTTVEAFRTASLVRFTLLTGRTHQIRVHSSYVGHPILGDPLYGGETEGVSRLMLHAASVTIDYPLGGKHFTVEAPLPENFTAILNELRFRKIP